MTPRTARADRLAHPTTRDAIRAVAENHGACLHPIQLRRINTDTGQTDQILIPCGATLASKCESLDREAKRLGVTRQSIIKVWSAERLEQHGTSAA
jgi:hypothetical protein